MKPTVGRIVYYTDALRHTRASIVTQVHHDESTLDLAVFWPDRSEPRQNIKHDEDHSIKTWDWMPYQKQKNEEK